MRKVLDVVIGIAEYHYKYVEVLVIDLDNKFTIFSTIAEAQPQTANSAFASGFRNKLNSFMRTNPDIHYLLVFPERTIRSKFICNRRPHMQ